MLSGVLKFSRHEFVRGFRSYPDPPKGPKRIYDVKNPYTIFTPCVVVMALLSYSDYRKRKEKRELRERQRRGPEFGGEEK
ncbi:hypothetical protein TNCV_3454241 [Trichonephila clavipes]|nr:hypothetical protein TNCV_3454241 [Trichonephila clavipes]